MNISAWAAQLHQLLGLSVPPVALAFRPAAPAGVRRVATPSPAMIPEVLQSAHGTTSLGCLGNRFYTELTDDELYFAIPGPAIAEVVGKLDAIISANRELQKYHRSRAHGSDVSLEAGEFGRYGGSDERPIQEM